MPLYNGKLYLGSYYGGIAHLRGNWSYGVLNSVGVARNWALDDLQSYPVGAISTFTGAIGYSAAPTVSYGSAAIVEYTEPRNGQTRKCLELSPLGCEIVFPLAAWSPFYQVSTTHLTNIPEGGATLNVENWTGWCKGATGGPSNASTPIFFGNKWAYGVGGIGTYEPLPRFYDAVDGNYYYQCNNHAWRRAYGFTDYNGGVSGGNWMESFGGANASLKRCLWKVQFHRNPVWWYGYSRSHNGTTIGGWPKFTKDMEPAHAMRLARISDTNTTAPPWLGGAYLGYGGGFQVLPLYNNGEMDHAVIYYKEQSGTYPLRIYHIVHYLGAVAPITPP